MMNKLTTSNEVAMQSEHYILSFKEFYAYLNYLPFEATFDILSSKPIFIMFDVFKRVIRLTLIRKY